MVAPSPINSSPGAHPSGGSRQPRVADAVPRWLPVADVRRRVSASNARIALGVALASTTLAASGCGARVHSAATPPVAAPATEPSKLDGHAVAPYPAPEFGLKSQTGAKVKLTAQRGRVVLVTV